MTEKGQTAIEVIAIATVLLGLLLASTLIIFQMNSDTVKIASTQDDTLRCEAIANTITNFNSNKGYSQAKLESLDKEASIKNGGILVGSIGCRYSGNAFLQLDAVPAYTDDSTGFALEKGKAYKIKKIEAGTVFCDVQEAWC